jgi:hypothetical protein
MDIPLEFLVCCAVPVALFVTLVLLGDSSRERGTPSHPEPDERGGPPGRGEAQHAEGGGTPCDGRREDITCYMKEDKR